MTSRLKPNAPAENAARDEPEGGVRILVMNEWQQSHIDYYLKRLEYRKGCKPASSTARLLAACDADEAHPLKIEEEATEVEYP